MITTEFFTLDTTKPVIDPDDWAAASERVNRASERCVASLILQQQRREAEERLNALSEGDWAD